MNWRHTSRAPAIRRQAERQVPVPQAIVTVTIPVLRTLGDLQFKGGASHRLSSPRIGLALLTYVARRSPRATDRGALADLFWRERHSGRARQSLRQVLLELKRLVGGGLLLDHERVSLAPNTLALEAEEFEGMVRAGHWRRAVGAWGGEFLSTADNLGGEDFRLWLESEREGLHHHLRLALCELLRESLGNGNLEECACWARRWVELLPMEEEGQRHLIELLQRPLFVSCWRRSTRGGNYSAPGGANHRIQAGPEPASPHCQVAGTAAYPVRGRRTSETRTSPQRIRAREKMCASSFRICQESTATQPPARITAATAHR